MVRTTPKHTGEKRKASILPWHSTKKKYDSSMPEKVFRLALLGATEMQMAEGLLVGKSTFESWMRTKEEFRAAVHKGKMEADARVANALYRKAIGYEHKDTHIVVVAGRVQKIPITKHYAPDTIACIFWLKNRTRNMEQPWVDAMRNELTGVNGGPISFDKLDLKDFSKEQLELLLTIEPKLRNKKNKEDE